MPTLSQPGHYSKPIRSLCEQPPPATLYLPAPPCPSGAPSSLLLLTLYQHHCCSGAHPHHQHSPTSPLTATLYAHPLIRCITTPPSHLPYRSPSTACELPHTHAMYPYRRPRRTLPPDAMGPSTVVDPPQRHAVDDGPVPSWSARRPRGLNGAQVRPSIGSHVCQTRHSTAHQRRPSLLFTVCRSVPEDPSPATGLGGYYYHYWAIRSPPAPTSPHLTHAISHSCPLSPPTTLSNPPQHTHLSSHTHPRACPLIHSPPALQSTLAN